MHIITAWNEKFRNNTFQRNDAASGATPSAFGNLLGALMVNQSRPIYLFINLFGATGDISLMANVDSVVWYEGKTALISQWKPFSTYKRTVYKLCIFHIKLCWCSGWSWTPLSAYKGKAKSKTSHFILKCQYYLTIQFSRPRMGSSPSRDKTFHVGRSSSWYCCALVGLPYVRI